MSYSLLRRFGHKTAVSSDRIVFKNAFYGRERVLYCGILLDSFATFPSLREQVANT